MSRRAKQKRHMQFIYCHSLDTPATPNTSGGRPRRWAGQRQLKRCRWRLIGFMPHLCVGANSWNCAAARLASLRLELVLKISSVMSVTWNRGQRQLGARLGGVAATNSMRAPTRHDSNNCKLLPLLAHTTFEDFKWNYAKTFGPNFLKRSAAGEGRLVVLDGACFRQACGISIAVTARTHTHKHTHRLARNLLHNEFHKLTQIKDTSK